MIVAFGAGKTAPGLNYHRFIDVEVTYIPWFGLKYQALRPGCATAGKSDPEQERNVNRLHLIPSMGLKISLISGYKA
jgi:hypothetical protein